MTTQFPRVGGKALLTHSKACDLSSYLLSLTSYIKQIFDFQIVFQDCIYIQSISPFCKVKGQLSHKHVKAKKDQKRAYIRNAGRAGPSWSTWGVVCKSEVMGSLIYGKITTVR